MAQIVIDSDVWAGMRAALRAVEEQMAVIEAKAAEVTSKPAPAPAIVLPAPRPKIAWGAKVSQVFRDRVWWISDTITAAQGVFFDPNWLMACIAWESGESFSPSKKNMAGSGATGLIQFMPTTARDLGTTTERLAAMTAEDQLNYVYKYFRDIMAWRKLPIKSLEDCYMAILWPMAVGKAVSEPIFDKHAKPTTYRQNAGLDRNKDGVVTVYECAEHVRAKLTKGLTLAA